MAQDSRGEYWNGFTKEKKRKDTKGVEGVILMKQWYVKAWVMCFDRREWWLETVRKL